MAAFRKLLYVPRFDTQSPQTDKESGYNGENNKHHKLNGLTQEATPLLFPDVTSPEITPCFSRKVKTNQLLRLYANMRSTVNLRASKGGKSRRAKRVTYKGVEEQPKRASSDTFGFPPRDVEADEMYRSRTKQYVLRTIKRMVEENRVIRERLLTLRQQSRSK
ncbi:uncharacterized protein si:ch211-277c7.7 [Onychostoma macrolepis]|uniref:Uncharacterized protein n=1 Tax=Onychostoma macrolepis TaxID=369639 RepID=A0A7J6CDD0_9TELE|nr:uncharacterized protein si:ch211-277c7.7 [Onychostoma macrolepis]KAF4104645.1 hypothetical protein G5714_013976 [Onychostoma macrolepis]